MNNLNVGDIVFVTTNIYDDYLRHHPKSLQPGNFGQNIAFAKSIGLRLIVTEKYTEDGMEEFYVACLGEQNWGCDQDQVIWDGFDDDYVKVKTWIVSGQDICKYDSKNQISLYELNRGL